MINLSLKPLNRCHLHGRECRRRSRRSLSEKESLVKVTKNSLRYLKNFHKNKWQIISKVSKWQIRFFNEQDHEALEYLKEIGPDTLVPCFTVNRKGNKSIEECNSLNMAIFQDLSHSTGETTAHRIPMIVTSSSMLHHKHSSALKNFKKRLGVRD